MAEVYPPGVVRIFYKSTGFVDGVDVTAKIGLRDLSWSSLRLTGVGNGLYYVDVSLAKGTYPVVFYEDGNKTTAQVYDIRRENRGDSGSLIGL